WRFEEPVDLGAANQYRHGETLPTTMTGRHWVLMTYAASGFAVGHAVNGTIKNFYPKGLRI
ncbi:MAG: RNA methyltransferase, partial [Schleiferilactobacillus perolens]